ncbi:Reticulon-like protein B2 [Abeliophyllum distichum]|uniref:Reticulon-like protein n=1 Tax=Abeliophyllum distichum TaxID=126358 RepID=A0ABD1TXS8_9LAMI
MPPKQPSKTNGNSRLFGKPVHSVFGGGKIADILLWKNYKLSGGVLGGATIIWILLEIVGYHVLTIVSRVLIVALGAMFIWSWGAIFIKNINHPRGACVEVGICSEDPNQSIIGYSQGRRIRKIFKEVSLATVLLFTVPLFYDKYKNQANSFLVQLMAEIKKYYRVVDAKVVSKIPIGESRN